MQEVNFTAPRIDDPASTTDDDNSTTDDDNSTTDDAASATSQSGPAAELSPIKEYLVLDNKGRLLIDVVGPDYAAPHRKRTYRHRASLDVMERASPAWKDTIFGTKGKERQRPTNEDEDWIILLPDDDEPLPITVQLAVIHEQPDVISKFITTADKYGTLPLLRPFVSDWLAHARPRSRIRGGPKALRAEFLYQLDVAWQLGALGVVEDFVRRLVFTTDSTPASLAELVAEVNLTYDVVGVLAPLPKLLDVLVAGVNCQKISDIPGLVLLERAARSPFPYNAVNRALCNALLQSYNRKRMNEDGVGQIPVEAKDYQSSIHRLLHIMGHILGTSRNPGPKQLDGYTCVRDLHKKFKDFVVELLGRWTPGSESVLESEQVAWLKKRAEILATERPSA